MPILGTGYRRGHDATYLNWAHAALENQENDAHSTASQTHRSYAPPTDLFYYSQKRQHGSLPVNANALVSSYVSKQLPGLLKQKEFDLGEINKVFAASWLSDRQVVFGTKCNQVS